MTWLVFTLIATITSGIFGVLTHAGQKAMGNSANGQYKAPLFAGVGYSLGAIVGLVLICKVQRHPMAFAYKRDNLGDLGGGCQWDDCVRHSLGILGRRHAGCGHDHLIHRCVAYQCNCLSSNRYTPSGRITMAVSRRSPVSDLRCFYGNNLSAGDVTRKPLNSTTHFFARSY